MKAIFFITAVACSLFNYSNAQISVSTLKHYVKLSPSELDQELSKRSFSFESSRRNEDSSGMIYEWQKDRNKATVQEIKWAWVKDDTVGLYQEETHQYLGYTDQITRRVLFNSLTPAVFNTALNELSNDKSYKREDKSGINEIKIDFTNRDWYIILSKYKPKVNGETTYSILVEERYTVTYLIHNLDKSIEKNKKIDLGE